jgi:hypothetical protein
MKDETEEKEKGVGELMVGEQPLVVAFRIQH